MQDLMSDFKDNDDARDTIVMRTCYLMSENTSSDITYATYSATANINTCLQEILTKKRNSYIQRCSKDKVSELPNKE